MTTEQVKKVLSDPHKPLVLFLLAYYANLKDREMNALICRYLRGMTQEETAEQLNRTTNTIYNWEQAGLEICAKAWEGNELVAQILENE